MKLTSLERERLNTIRQSNRVLNVIRGSTGETKTHFMAKCSTCYELLKIKNKFVTEAIFENGKRADVVDLTYGVIYEIVFSEKVESIEKKKKEYPELFVLQVVNCDK